MSIVNGYDLLLKEIEDPYVQENFRKLKRYLECLDVASSGSGTGLQGPVGPAGPAGADGADGGQDVSTMGVASSVNIGDFVYQDYAQDNFAITATTNDTPSPIIGIVLSKPTPTTAVVLFGGEHNYTIGEGPLFMSPSGILQLGVPSTGVWQRMGWSFGDGTIWLRPERTRIRGC